MAEDDKIRYSDIIEPDDSIEKLIRQLSEVNRSYETTVNAIRAGAEKIAQAIKSSSGATSEGRKAIDEAAISASRLERAQYELRLAMSETGKEIAVLKARTAALNKSTVEQYNYNKQAATSYDRLKSDLKETVELYKSLSSAERLDPKVGGELLDNILALKNRIKFLDDQMKVLPTTYTEVEKAEQRLAYLQSNEGQRLLDLKAKIQEVIASRKRQKEVIDPIIQAQEKLAYATSDENRALKAYTMQIREANNVAQLQAQIANSAEGSYNRLSAQYSLNKIRLNQMSAAEREAVDVGKKLEEETLAIYEQMRKLQEATGNYRLSVGHYQRAWDGLGFSISQVVRELPAMAVSANTFFLAISNNIPMVADEINRLRLENKKLQAEGKETVNIGKSIVKALFSWNSAMVVILAVFSVWGKDILNWISSLFKAKAAVISNVEALKNIAKELENTNASYGSNIVKVKQLSNEWKNLKTTAEKNQWIKDNKTNFDQLGISINNVTEAENAFIDNTDALIKSLKLKARAAAAQKLASEQYEKALIKENEIRKEEANQLESIKTNAAYYAKYGVATPQQQAFPGGAAQRAFDNAAIQKALQDISNTYADRIKKLTEEKDLAEQTADAYYELAEADLKAADAELKAANIEKKHKKDREKRGREPRDLTDTINRNAINIQKQYEQSVTKLRSDEYAKRRKETADQVQDANNKLREMYRKNVDYVNNVNKKYKQLTEDQKKQIAQQQDWITKTIANNLKLLALQLTQIQKEQQINSLRIRRETINNIDTGAAVSSAQNQETTVTTNVTVTRDVSQMETSLVKERKLMEENLDLEYALVLDTNKKLLDEGDTQARSEEEILIELNKKKLELWSEYDQKILNTRAADIENQLELVKKGSEDELNLLLRQNEVRRQLALVQNAAKPAEQQVSTSVINAQFDKSGAQVRGTFEMKQLEDQQKLDEAVFNEIKRNELEVSTFKLGQEKERWQKQIQLAEAGALDWSQAQIDAAKSAVKGIDRELLELNNFIGRIGEKGAGGALLEKLGFDDKAISAFEGAVNTVISNLQDIMAAEVELARAAVEAAEERVDAAQSAYDAEVEARNNGYANNVATAKKELEQEKKNQLQKQKLLEEAKRRQEAVNTVVQASSLVTASANIWSSLSSIPFIGPALAIAAIATMWTSFAAAKIKARQVTAQSEEYGEGGLEFLEGGSHASGNDIDLQTKNAKGKNMRAEGGEALAIINKRKTRKYKKVLPDVIDSLNRGTFEDKYLNAFAKSDSLNIALNSRGETIDLSRIEGDVRSIKRQNEIRYYSLPNGQIVIQTRNVKRIIK